MNLVTASYYTVPHFTANLESVVSSMTSKSGLKFRHLSVVQWSLDPVYINFTEGRGGEDWTYC